MSGSKPFKSEGIFGLETLVVGTGRCGTGSMAKKLGIGHESVFGVRGIDRAAMIAARGDSSWLAVPHLAWLRGCGLVDRVVWVVRDPLEVWGSLLSQKGLFVDSGGVKSPYGRFVEAQLGLEDVKCRKEKCRHFMVTWTSLIVNGGYDERVKVEELEVKVNSRWRDTSVGVPGSWINEIAEVWGYE